MTDPAPPFELDPIVVTGQRRRPGGTFPAGPGGGGPGGGGGGGDQQNQIEDQPYEPPPHPCGHPETALEWNADAAAAEARAKFLAKAAELGDDELYQREFHAFLYRDPSGRIQVGGVSAGNRVGSTEESTVGRDWTGITPDNLVGSVHNHPGGSLTPSGDDWAAFDGIRSWIAQFSGSQRAQEYRHYIIARNTSDPTAPMLPRVYTASHPRNDEPGPEVNPEGQPCP